MIASKLSALAAVAALSEQAIAFNSHRHLHNEYEKHDVVVVVETVWDIVTVTGDWGVSSTTTSSTSTSTSTSTTSTTSTSTTTTSTPPPPPPTTSSTHTTLATVAKAANSEGALNVLPSISVSLAPPPPPTTSQAPAPAPSSSSGSGKRGIGYNDAALADLMSTECGGKCGWAYNWGSGNDGLSADVEYIATLWGPTSEFTSDWTSAATEAIANGGKHLFSFNEPDNAGQANLSPSEAASAHRQYMNPFAGKAAIGAPAITNSASQGQGLSWLSEFFTACDSIGGCQIDFCNLHWYNEVDQLEDLFDHLSSAAELCKGKPLYLTEFAPINASPSQTASFLSSALPRLDAFDGLDGYAFFMTAVDNLMESATSLSTFGEVYAGN